MTRVAPDEVRRLAVRVEQIKISAVRVSSDQARHEAVPIGGGTPKKRWRKAEASAVGRNEQVIEPVLRILGSVLEVWQRGDLTEREEQLGFPRAEVDAPDPGVVGRGDVPRRVGNRGITVARSGVMKTAKVGRDCPRRVGAEGVYRRSQCPPVPGDHIENMADEPPSFAVIPDHLRFRTGEPLEHAPLLPVPGAALPELDPAVVVAEVDHPDLDRLVGAPANGARSPLASRARIGRSGRIPACRNIRTSDARALW